MKKKRGTDPVMVLKAAVIQKIITHESADLGLGPGSITYPLWTCHHWSFFLWKLVFFLSIQGKYNYM